VLVLGAPFQVGASHLRLTPFAARPRRRHDRVIPTPTPRPLRASLRRRHDKRINALCMANDARPVAAAAGSSPKSEPVERANGTLTHVRCGVRLHAPVVCVYMRQWHLDTCAHAPMHPPCVCLLLISYA
jgi:hypothetical protein